MSLLLIKTVYNVIRFYLQRYGEVSKQRLDRAILTFFQNFRRSYVGDLAMHSSKVSKHLHTAFPRISLQLLMLLLATAVVFQANRAPWDP